MFDMLGFLLQILELRKVLLGHLISTVSNRNSSDAATGLASSTTRNLADFKHESFKLLCCLCFCPFVTGKKYKTQKVFSVLLHTEFPSFYQGLHLCQNQPLIKQDPAWPAEEDFLLQDRIHHCSVMLGSTD